MDNLNLGSEVSAKIRAAIKAKLIELNVYVDEELPDYIMVMVANKKDRPQMEGDLGLFLNENTAAFVEWLTVVLKKLEKVTLGEWMTGKHFHRRITRNRMMQKMIPFPLVSFRRQEG